jgi:hypothetical protein
VDLALAGCDEWPSTITDCPFPFNAIVCQFMEKTFMRNCVECGVECFAKVEYVNIYVGVIVKLFEDIMRGKK